MCALNALNNQMVNKTIEANLWLFGYKCVLKFANEFFSYEQKHYDITEGLTFDPRAQNSYQLILWLKWIFFLNLKKFPQVIPKYHFCEDGPP